MRRLFFVCALTSLPLAGAGVTTESWPPPTLRETGLYADWNTKTVAADKVPFSPQYPLWTDGAIKTRWIQLPPGGVIDASDPDAWQFPVGTKFWKEFKFARRAETRFIEHTTDGWKYAAYAWNDDETDAPLAPVRGIRYSVEIRDGVRHGIPSQSDCKSCHEGGPSRILGFSALQLSSDRDPNALHRERVPDGAVLLPDLVARGVLRGLPAHLTDGAPRIAAETPVARAALGYLHGNCSACHSSAGELASLKFSLQYSLLASDAGLPPAVATAAEQPSKFVPADWASPERVCTGNPDTSVLAARMNSRNPVMQMPPLGSRVVDDEAVALIRRWIRSELGSQAPRHTRTEDR